MSTFDFRSEGLDRLRAAGLKITSQRVAILDVFADQLGHYTPQDVCAVLADRKLSLSTATVYNALETFEDLGIVRRFTLGGRTYFDGNVHVHHHARCDQCGEIVDVEIPETDLTSLVRERLSSFEIVRAHVQVEGRCSRCAPR